MVSIIIPVYNSENTLSACAESLLNQTYKDYELILIDDGSTDHSSELCDELQETCRSRGVRCQVLHQENGGVSKARNCGMDHTNGEYFVCVDSDDVVEPCYLEDLVRTAEAHPEFGHVICGFKCTSHVHDYIFTDREPLTVSDRRDYMRLYEKILVQGPCFALYRTNIVRDNGIRMREDLSRAEDTLFNLDYLDALDCTSIGIVNKPNYIYQNEDQSSLYRKYRKDLLSIIEEVEQAILDKLKRWNITDTASWQKYYNMVFFDHQSLLRNVFHKQNPMSMREKVMYGNMVLRRESFQEALQKSTVSLSPVLRRAYRSGKYKNVLAVERAQRMKQRIISVFKGN